jgi:hypothetical protein
METTPSSRRLCLGSEVRMANVFVTIVDMHPIAIEAELPLAMTVHIMIATL